MSDLTTHPLFTFEAFYKDLHLDEGVENAFSDLESHYSVLKTLTEGYTVYLRRHKEFLSSKLSNVIPQYRANFETFYQELEKHVKKMNKEVDIIQLSEEKDHLNEKLKQWKCNTGVEDSILADIVLIKKRNGDILRTIHPHTQEFCLRIMSAAENMRAANKFFSRRIEDLVSSAKTGLHQIAVKKFQEARVQKLREVCKTLQAEASLEFAARMLNYKDLREKLRFSQEKLHRQETEKDRLLAELRILPDQNKSNMEKLIETNDRQKMKLIRLEARASEINNKLRTEALSAKEDKKKAMLERAKLQSLLAKEQACLCQIVKHCKIHGFDLVVPDQNICAD